MARVTSEYNFLRHAADKPRARIEELKKEIAVLQAEMKTLHKDYFQASARLNGEMIDNNDRISKYVMSPGPVSPGFLDLLHRKL